MTTSAVSPGVIDFPLGAPPPAAPAPAIAPPETSDSLSISAAAGAIADFEQSQAPPPFTLQDFQPNPARDNARSLAAPPSVPTFQIRQFSNLIKTLSSITSAAFPTFSYSA